MLANNEDSYQSAKMYRLVWVFAGRIYISLWTGFNVKIHVKIHLKSRCQSDSSTKLEILGLPSIDGAHQPAH